MFEVTVQQRVYMSPTNARSNQNTTSEMVLETRMANSKQKRGFPRHTIGWGCKTHKEADTTTSWKEQRIMKGTMDQNHNKEE